MKSRIRTHKKRTREQIPDTTAQAKPMFQSRSFVVQKQQEQKSQPTDIKTSLKRAERYGHKLGGKKQEQGEAAKAVTTELEFGGVKQLTEQPGESSQQGNERGSEAEEQDNWPEIPSIVHFIWIGKKPKQTALENIKNWAKKKGEGVNKNWKIKLWTDSDYGTPNWLDSWGLKGKVEICEVKGELDERIKSHYVKATKKGAMNMASDLARYSILLRQGGVYADVDIGPGEVDLFDLSQVEMRVKELPYFAPMIRDREDLESKGGKAMPNETKDQLRDRLKKAFDVCAQAGGGGINNNLIAAPKANKIIERIILECQKKLDNTDEEDVKAETAVALTGPTIVQQVVTEYLSKQGVKPEEESIWMKKMQGLLPSVFANLEWLTPESENQLHK